MPPEADVPEEEQEDEDDDLDLRFAENQQEDQTTRFQGLLARLPVTAALISVIVGFSAIAFVLIAQDPRDYQLALAVATLLVFLLSVGCTTVAIGKNLGHRGPTARQVRQIKRDAGSNAARNWAVEQMIIAYEINKKIVDSTGRWARAAQISAFVDAILAVATVLAALFD